MNLVGMESFGIMFTKWNGVLTLLQYAGGGNTQQQRMLIQQGGPEMSWVWIIPSSSEGVKKDLIERSMLAGSS